MNLKPYAVALLLSASLLFVACSDDDSEPDATTPPPTSTVPVEPTTAPSPVPTAQPGAPAAPTNLRIDGRLPDLSQTVTPGEGESGRITLTWDDNSADEDGFRVYQDCGGQVSELFEVEADTTTYGPLQVCRPGKVGVASYTGAATSSILWSP